MSWETSERCCRSTTHTQPDSWENINRLSSLSTISSALIGRSCVSLIGRLGLSDMSSLSGTRTSLTTSTSFTFNISVHATLNTLQMKEKKTSSCSQPAAQTLKHFEWQIIICAHVYTLIFTHKTERQESIPWSNKCVSVRKDFLLTNTSLCWNGLWESAEEHLVLKKMMCFYFSNGIRTDHIHQNKLKSDVCLSGKQLLVKTDRLCHMISTSHMILIVK